MAFYPVRRGRLSPVLGEGVDRSNEFGARADWWWTPARSLQHFPKSVGNGGVMASPVNGGYFGPANVCLTDTFTVFLLLCCPNASIAQSSVINVGSGNGFRLDMQTTSGGIYARWTANGVANGNNTPRDATAVFDSRPIAIVSDWNSSGQTSWWERRGEPEVTWSDSWNYAEPSNATVDLGAEVSQPASLYAAAILRGNLGAAAARRLLRSPWQMFQ